jgi:hypothetical protein
MVGIAPTSVRVYSIRVVPPGQGSIPFANYSYAISLCLHLRISTQPAVSVTNLSLGTTNLPTNTDLADLTDTIDTARLHGIDVVGAAGNDGAIAYPAAYPPVLAVGAGDAAPQSTGVLCGFSKGEGLDVISPGCDTLAGGIDEAFADDGSPAVGFGTSQAAALTSAVLAAMRAYEPSLSVAEAELCLTASEQNGGNIDVALAFSDCGLGRVVQAGVAAIPVAPPEPPPPASSSGSTQVAGSVPTMTILPVRHSLPRPRVGRTRLARGRLTINVLNRPANAYLEAKIVVNRGHRSIVVATRRSASSSIAFRVSVVYAVELRFVAPPSRTSSWILKVI